MSQDIKALEIARNVKPRTVGAFLTGPSNQDCFAAADCIIAQVEHIEELERQLAELRQAPEGNAFVYHYHASHQNAPGSINHMDGIVQRSLPIDSINEYRSVKQAIADFHAIGNVERVTIESLTQLAAPSAGQAKSGDDRREG